METPNQAYERAALGTVEMPKKRRKQHQVVREKPSQLPNGVAPVRIQGAVDEVGCRTEEDQAKHYRGLWAQPPRKDVGVQQQRCPFTGCRELVSADGGQWR